MSVLDQAGSRRRRRLHVDMPRSNATSVCDTSLSSSAIGSPAPDASLPSDFVHEWLLEQSNSTRSPHSPSADPATGLEPHRGLDQRVHSSFSSDAIGSALSLPSHPAGLDDPQVGIEFVLS